MAVGIIDCGMGNILSVQRMFSKVGQESVISNSPDELDQCQGLVLPGVGTFDFGMANLHKHGLTDFLRDRVINQGIPILGICLGMQLLFQRSEEGVSEGLGILKGEVKKFNFPETSRLPVPHMGWNRILPAKAGILFPRIEAQRFYFVHSYHVVPEERSVVAAETLYGSIFTCAVETGHVMGVQFHPEKSHRFGMNLLKEFSRYLAERQGGKN